MKNLAYHLAHLGVFWYTPVDCRRQTTLDSESETLFSDLCQRSSAVELWFCKPVVVGSNPTVGLIMSIDRPVVCIGGPVSLIPTYSLAFGSKMLE